MLDPHVTEDDAKYWPTYRPRRDVCARRLARTTNIGGVLYADGYMVRDAAGAIHVMSVAAFEAVYELAALTD